jgi:hypothetical protein
MRTLSLLVFVALCSPAWAQQAASPPQATPGVDEIVVPGSRPENLRVEIERLEGAVYERWNALNTNDEFDIHCREMEPTGSNIPLRTCAPNFVVEAESSVARNQITDGRSTRGRRDPAELRTQLEQKSRALTEEMQRVAREDEQLLRDLVRLDELRQLQTSERQQRGQR